MPPAPPDAAHTFTAAGNDPPAAAASSAAGPASARQRCARCALPLPACLCRFITPTTNHWPLLVLQHPLELRQAKGSARLLRLSLARCRLEVGEHFSEEALDDWLAPASGEAQPLLLYPDDPGSSNAPAAPGLAASTALAMGHPATPRRLVLLDGTWRQARRLLQCNPQVAALPRWALPTPPPSRYAIRKAHRPQQRSTLEAACLALATLEGEAAVYVPLLAAFDAWVACLAARAAAGRRRSLTSA